MITPSSLTFGPKKQLNLQRIEVICFHEKGHLKDRKCRISKHTHRCHSLSKSNIPTIPNVANLSKNTVTRDLGRLSPLRRVFRRLYPSPDVWTSIERLDFHFWGTSLREIAGMAGGCRLRFTPLRSVPLRRHPPAIPAISLRSVPPIIVPPLQSKRSVPVQTSGSGSKRLKPGFASPNVRDPLIIC